MDPQPSHELGERRKPQFELKAHQLVPNLEANPRRQDKVIAAIVRRDPHIILQHSAILTTDERQSFTDRCDDKQLNRLRDVEFINALSATPINIKEPKDEQNLKNVWEKFSGDEHTKRRMRRVIAFATKGDIGPQDQVTPDDLYTFVKSRHLTAVAFERMIPDILPRVDDPEAYKQVLHDVGLALYGGQWVYLEQGRLAQAEAQAPAQDTATERQSRFTVTEYPYPQIDTSGIESADKTNRQTTKIVVKDVPRPSSLGHVIGVLDGENTPSAIDAAKQLDYQINLVYKVGAIPGYALLSYLAGNLKDYALNKKLHTAFIQTHQRDNTLHTISSGDVGIVLDSNGQALNLSASYIATPPVNDDENNIKNYYVNRDSAGTSVQSAQAPTDIPANAEIVKIKKLHPTDKRVIIANGALWSSLPMQQALDLIKDENDPTQAAKILETAARQRGSTDELSIVVSNLPRIQKEDIPTPESEAEKLAKLTRQHGMGYLHGKFPPTLEAGGYSSGEAQTIGNFGNAYESSMPFNLPPDNIMDPKRHANRQIWTAAFLGNRHPGIGYPYIRGGNTDPSKQDWVNYNYYMPISPDHDPSRRSGTFVLMNIAIPPTIAAQIDTAVASDRYFPDKYFKALYPNYVGENTKTHIQRSPAEELAKRDLRKTNNPHLVEVVPYPHTLDAENLDARDAEQPVHEERQRTFDEIADNIINHTVEAESLSMQSSHRNFLATRTEDGFTTTPGDELYRRRNQNDLVERTTTLRGKKYGTYATESNATYNMHLMFGVDAPEGRNGPQLSTDSLFVLTRSRDDGTVIIQGAGNVSQESMEPRTGALPTLFTLIVDNAQAAGDFMNLLQYYPEDTLDGVFSRIRPGTYTTLLAHRDRQPDHHTIRHLYFGESAPDGRILNPHKRDY